MGDLDLIGSLADGCVDGSSRLYDETPDLQGSVGIDHLVREPGQRNVSRTPVGIATRIYGSLTPCPRRNDT